MKFEIYIFTPKMGYGHSSLIASGPSQGVYLGDIPPLSTCALMIKH